MKSDLFPAGIPRLNHIGLSVAADVLDEAGRAEICDFWGDVFGWTELPSETEDRKKMVLAIGHWDQFVFIHAEDEPMHCPPLDHFGVSVLSQDDLESAWARVAARKAADDRVEVLEPRIDDFGPVKIHAFYVRFLLPMMVECQYWEFT